MIFNMSQKTLKVSNYFEYDIKSIYHKDTTLKSINNYKMDELRYGK